ncbi:MAG: aldehyde dehydrogenase family protein [Gammaproteobacteria bacterium]|nr:aldehyde dehydrogenase family protein [Gammaproteobacteria bacterium]
MHGAKATGSIDWVAKAAALRPQVRNLIDGRSLPGTAAAELHKVSPRDGQELYRIAAGSPGDVDAAVTAARQAFADGRWSRRAVQRRSDALLRLAALLAEHAEELALLESLDTGKPIKDAVAFDVPRAVATFKFSAAGADKLTDQVYGVDPNSLSYQARRPLGVVGGIIGWNFPLVLAAEKIGPALVMGNSLVLKPSELTSLSAVRVAQLALEAGIPEGVLNVIHGSPEVGSALAHHADVDMITFTGSSRTGKLLLVASGESNMKRLMLECGGKAPNIVFDDAPDLAAVADSIIARAFWNQGQVCTASSRLLVQEGIKDELLKLVIERAARLHPGDPLREQTTFGALVSGGHREKVLGYIAAGEREGAQPIYRATTSAPLPGGFYVAPVIFDKVSAAQRIAQEEIFGPVLAVLGFRDEAEAAHLANGTIYGLSAILWTKDVGRAHRMSQSIDAGWIVVNATASPTGGTGPGILSIGGHKQSGIGVEGGVEGLKAYTRESAIQIFV